MNTESPFDRDSEVGIKGAGLFYSAPWKVSDLLFLLFFLLAVLFLWLALSAFPSLSAFPGARFGALVAILGLELAIPFWIIRTRTATERASLSFLLRVKDVLWGILAYFLIVPGVLATALLLSPWETATLVDRLKLLRESHWIFQILLGLSAFTIVPICEEIFFRGFVFNALRSRFSISLSIFAQSVLFAVLHPYGVTYPFYIFVIGFGLGVLYQKRKRLLAPIVTHAVFNFIAGVLVIFIAVLNHHVPAGSLEEARRSTASSRWLLEPMDAYVQDYDPEMIMEFFHKTWGPQGIDAWKIEAMFLQALAESSHGDPAVTREALLRASRLYRENGDPFRAEILADRAGQRLEEP